LAALDAVRDPELDEPVTELGFVSSCTLSNTGDAEVRLRLPTFFCAPNFAFLMVADAYDAVSKVPGVRQVEVVLEDHFAADVINAGSRPGPGSSSPSWPCQRELDELRADFVRKAVLAGTDRVCRPLLAAGRTLEDLAGLTLGEVPPSADLSRLRERRAELDLPSDDGAPLLVDAVTGAALGVESLPLHLQRTRLTRVNTEANGSMCRGMLGHRYVDAGRGQLEEVR